MHRRKILIIRNAARSDFGGGERYPVFLADILNRNGFETLLISRSKKLLEFATVNSVETVRGWWWRKQNWNGSQALLFPIYFIWQVILFSYYTTLFLRKKPTAVHIQSKDDFISATFAAKLTGSVVVWTDHADLKHIWKNVTVWYKNPVGKLVHAAARFAGSITVVSESEYDLVSKNLRKNDRIRSKLEVVHNGVVDTASHPRNTTQDSNKGLFTFCVASRLVKDKGISEAIAAFELFQEKHPKSRLWLMGDGPDSDYFQEKTDNPHVVFLGHKTDPLDYISKCNVFVHPTYHEGFSVALIEASMLGKAIIATNVGGNPEIIHDKETGILIRPRDTKDLFAAMELMYGDPTLLSSLGESARNEYLDNFILEDIVTKKIVPKYMKVKIGIEVGSLASHNVSGVGYYTKRLTESLDASDSTTTYATYFNFLNRQKEPGLDRSVTVHKNLLFPQRIYAKLHAFKLAPFYDALLPKVDLMIYPNFADWPTLKARKTAVVIHDLTYLRYPEYMEEKNLAYLRNVVPRSIESADIVITVSEAVKKELTETFDIESEKCIVTPIPPAKKFFEPSTRNIYEKYKIPTKKYILFVGNLEPRKNISTLVKAYALLPKSIKATYSLIIAGGKGWKTDESIGAINNAQSNGDKVLHIGYVDQDDAAALFQNAHIYVMPSHYEGFGMPVLESMAGGTPVIASDIPVLREAGGKAALYANPNDAKTFTDTIKRLIDSTSLYEKHVALGLSHAQNFKWEDNVHTIIEAIHDDAT